MISLLISLVGMPFAFPARKFEVEASNNESIENGNEEDPFSENFTYTSPETDDSNLDEEDDYEYSDTYEEDKLSKLKTLYEKGLIGEKEYEEYKKEVLKKMLDN